MATGDIKPVLTSLNTLTVTALQSLASSATAGWQSAEISNASNLYDEILVQVVLDFANTAPANSKGVFVFVASGLETGKLSNPASGAEGTITLVDVTTTPQNLRQIGFIPYTTQDEVAESGFMSFPAPPFWSLVLMNHSGAALAASLNTVKWMGKYYNVAA
jgi:hypothetical protein